MGTAFSGRDACLAQSAAQNARLCKLDRNQPLSKKFLPAALLATLAACGGGGGSSPSPSSALGTGATPSSSPAQSTSASPRLGNCDMIPARAIINTRIDDTS